MFKRKKWLIVLGLVGFILILVPFLLNFDFVKNMIKQYTSPLLSEEKQFEVFEASLIEDDGFFDAVSEKVHARGYEHYLHGLIYSKEDVHVEFVLTNRKVSEENRKEILAVFNETVLHHKMEPDIFEVEIRSE